MKKRDEKKPAALEGHEKLKAQALRMMGELTARQKQIGRNLAETDEHMAAWEQHAHACEAGYRKTIEEEPARLFGVPKMHRDMLRRRGQIQQLRGLIRGHPAFKRAAKP